MAPSKLIDTMKKVSENRDDLLLKIQRAASLNMLHDMKIPGYFLHVRSKHTGKTYLFVDAEENDWISVCEEHSTEDQTELLMLHLKEVDFVR
jgi:hypothetical protein